MYHHRPQQQGSQPFANGPRPPHHQHQNLPGSAVMSQGMDFPFHRPTQLPDELESALAIRGTRDMDHRLVEQMNRPTQHQNQCSVSGNGQRGSFGSDLVLLTSDNQPGFQQEVDWSSYQNATEPFSSSHPGTGHQPQRLHGPPQQSKGSHAGTRIPNWSGPVSDSPARHLHGGGGDGQGSYTAESAGSILASFGLSNEDLEVLSHYPDDQLTPDTLPFILRDIQINKTNIQKVPPNAPAPSSSSSFSRNIPDLQLPPSRSSPMPSSRPPEMASFLTVTQTAGKVIDYGHASRAKEENNTRETFKRESLSGERTVKMYASSTPPPQNVPRVDKVERHQLPLARTEASRHGDRDYRRANDDHRKTHRSPPREFSPLSKHRNIDRDYRREGPKPRISPDTESETSSRRSLSSSSGSKQLRSSSKKLPTATMISDFSAAVPKVYPHTCSLCHIECNQEKDWVDHINTVNHTAACRDLRNKYPDWKPDLSSRSGRYDTRSHWDPKDGSPSKPASRPVSRSQSPSPPHGSRRPEPHPRGRPYSPPHHHHYYHHHKGSSSRDTAKRSYDHSSKSSSDASRHPSKASHGSKPAAEAPSQTPAKPPKSGTKPGAKVAKTGSAKTTEASAKPPPAKKKKKVVPVATQDSSAFADRLVYLTGIPTDATEQEVTALAGSFGKINNVILIPCSEAEDGKQEGQQASVCMMRTEDAQALANSTSLSIRELPITASVAKQEAGPSAENNSSKPAAEEDTGATVPKTPSKEGLVLVSGLPESGWSESDIVTLVQPFGTASAVTMTAQLGKVLVTVPGVDIAEEMVKVNNFMPLKMGDKELLMTQVKQPVGLGTPVALYNLLMGSANLPENFSPVSWNTLLVIQNVPDTPTGSSEVQKLVGRFGTVIKTLVLSGMVICEMATAAMALSVHKRFQTFPCIIHNNPLIFSRKPDPKPSAQSRVGAEHQEPPEDLNATKSKRSPVADKDKMTQESISEAPAQHLEQDGAGQAEVASDSAAAAAAVAVVDDPAEEENKESDSQKPAVLQTMEKEEEAKEQEEEEAKEQEEEKEKEKEQEQEEQQQQEEEDRKSKEEPDESSAAGELKVSDSVEAAASDPPQGNKEEVKEEETSTPPDQCQAAEAEQSSRTGEKNAELTEEHLQKKEGQEERERDRRSKERREKEERARRERERREQERKERARRERKRPYEEESRSARKKSSRREELQSRKEEEEEEEQEEEEFPFNMSDFVTVDEVGDVTDLPGSPGPAASPVPLQEATPSPDLSHTSKVDADGVGGAVTPSESGGGAAPPADTLEELPPADAMAAESSHPQEEAPETAALESRTSETQQAPDPAPDPALVSVLDPALDSVLGPAAHPATDSAFDSVPEPAPDSVRDPAPVPAPGLSPPSEATRAAPEQSDAASGEVPCGAPTAAAGLPARASEGAPGAVPAGASSRASVTAPCGAPDGPCRKEPSRVPSEVPARGPDGATGQAASEAPGATYSHSGSSSELEKPSRGRHPAVAPAPETVRKASEKEKETPAETPTCSLPPYDPRKPVGLDLLVPKTGFFCKACNRFFCGAKQAEINHCKTLKHYESLQKYLQTSTAEGS
ncbi:uncharacterized protein LOC142904938 isoform X3 [Nelusetta ayraudi]|uniref:uncharacterized protein LOC142904938 isoform X3 n=1 Tax=Nelusetta ayraudi TaxID=303726 RepID=UPI003F6F81CC